MIDTDAALAALSLDDKCRLLAGKTTWRTKAFPARRHPRGEDVRRAQRRARRRTRRIEHAGRRGAVGHHPRRLVGPRPAGADRRAARHRGPSQGRAHPARTDREHPSHTGRRPHVRVLQRGPRTVRRAGRRLRHAASSRRTSPSRSSTSPATTPRWIACRVDVQVDDRPFREIYLRPFERAVKEGGAWGIMSAYNRLGGEHCAENHRLLTDILRDEWGFDGFVVSDWFGVHHTAEAANAGLNLEMPAPVRVYGDKLVAAVNAGEVVRGPGRSARARPARDDEPGARRRAGRHRRRAIGRRSGRAGADPSCRDLRHGAAAQRTGRRRRPCCRSTPTAVSRIAVIGPNAVTNQCMGGGSASLTPFNHRTLLAARHRPVRSRLGDRRHGHLRAGRAHRSPHPGDPWQAQLRQPNGEPGLRARVHQRHVVGRRRGGRGRRRPSSLVRFFGSIPAGVDPRGLRRADRRRVHPRHRRPAPDRRRVDRPDRSSPPARPDDLTRHRRRSRRAAATQPGVLRLRQHRGRSRRSNARPACPCRSSSCGGPWPATDSPRSVSASARPSRPT